MATPEQITPEIARLFFAKNERRKRLAALPYPEKVQAVVQLQRMAVPILKDRDKRARIWKINT
ncbi:MAG: hypothetical protein NTZ51_06640 [Proteobacteria bacterium]|nr:hypothetical protein [Pseudomonadota bacterium]